MMPYGLISLIYTLEEFSFFVAVWLSAPFGPALNPPKINNFRWHLINLISRVPKVSKLFINLWQHLRLDFSRIFPVYNYNLLKILRIIGVNPCLNQSIILCFAFSDRINWLIIRKHQIYFINLCISKTLNYNNESFDCL